MNATDKLDANRNSENEQEENIARLFNALRKRYRRRYEQKLDERFEITLEVSLDLNSSRSFKVKEQFVKNPNEGAAIVIINKAFAEEGRLLIVGNPGMGKTVLLLKLASNLLDKIDEKIKEREKHQPGEPDHKFPQIIEPFPVIFNLASWSERYEKFEDWLIARLISSQGLSRAFATTLLRQGRIIFLLDGLDELARNEDEKTAVEKRAACLKSLNQYLQRGRRVVICCRLAEFVHMQEATRQVAPVSAVIKICDLTEDQILIALSQARDMEENRASSANLLTILKDNSHSQFLTALRTPFYFTTALEVFDQQVIQEKDFPKDVRELKKYLIDKFVERKLASTPNPNDFEPQKTVAWLKWLAQLLESKQSITFELADLQPKYLLKEWSYRLGIGWVFGLVVGMGFSLIPTLRSILQNDLRDSLALGLVTGLSAGLVRGLEVGLREGLIRGMTFGLSVGVVGGLVFGLAIGFNIGLVGALVGGLVFGLGGALASRLVGNEILTEDIVRLDFTKLLKLRFWVKTLSHSMGVGLGIGLVTGLYSGLRGGLFGGLSGALIVGFVSSLVRLKNINSYAGLENPYQRIKGGLRVNLFTYGFLISVIIALLFFISRLNLGDSVTKTLTCILISLLVIYFHLLFFTPLLKHSILRLCFYLEGSTPIRYATFLDYATDLRVLEKDGGQWRFRHQNLQEYFANQV